MLGDGGVSNGQISITLGYSTDYDYAIWIIQLIKRLFNVTASTYKSLDCDAIKIRISGVNFVKNMLSLGLVRYSILGSNKRCICESLY